MREKYLDHWRQERLDHAKHLILVERRREVDRLKIADQRLAVQQQFDVILVSLQHLFDVLNKKERLSLFEQNILNGINRLRTYIREFASTAGIPDELAKHNLRDELRTVSSALLVS